MLFGIIAVKKLKQSHNTPVKAQGGRGGIALLIHDLGTR
jgi:hypothetical protein